MIACCTETVILRKQPSRSSEPTNDKIERIATHNSSESEKCQLSNHEDLRKNVGEKLEDDLRDKVMIADAYVETKYKYIEMPSNFDSKWDGHLGRINSFKIANRPIPDEPEAYSFHAVSAGPKARELEKNNIHKILFQRVTEANHIKWAATIVFALKHVMLFSLASNAENLKLF